MKSTLLGLFKVYIKLMRPTTPGDTHFFFLISSHICHSQFRIHHHFNTKIPFAQCKHTYRNVRKLHTVLPCESN